VSKKEKYEVNMKNYKRDTKEYEGKMKKICRNYEGKMNKMRRKMEE